MFAGSQLAPLDWLIIGAFLTSSLLVGVWARRRATKSTASYFKSGGNLPWWLLGTSIVATTFAADTPLAISGMVLNGGNATNWFWWCQVPMAMAGVFFFAHLWRRANPLTDMEFITLRYSGPEASFLRGFKALYLSLLYGTFVMGWVIKSMILILGQVFPGVDPIVLLAGLVIITVVYTAMGGLWGVVVTDFLQFWFAMAGCIYLAVAAVVHVGGPAELMARFAATYGEEQAGSMLRMVPDLTGEWNRDTLKFFLFITLAWWGIGFTDGGSYHAQRLLSARSEADARLGYLWYGVANFALRMWPWIIVGVCAAVMFPVFPDPETLKIDGARAELGYVKVMLTVLGPGLLGLMVATFFAAFMSTISTQINLGAAYLMNDFYKPFFAPRESERHYLRVGILLTVLMAELGVYFALELVDSIKDAWFLLGATNGGIGAIYILRWYWHRVSAWTEITCLALLILLAPITMFGARVAAIPGLHWVASVHVLFGGLPFSLMLSIPVAVGGAIIVTLLTRPVSREVLRSFEESVQAGGPGWAEIDAEIRGRKPGWRADSPLRWGNVGCWLLAVVAIYCYLLGIGKAVLGDLPGVDHMLPPRVLGFTLLVVGTALAAWLVAILRRAERPAHE